MAQIVLSAEDIISFGNTINNLNSDVQALFANLCTLMQQVAGVWQSPAASSLMDQFNLLRPNFDAYVQLISSYAQYLHQTAQAYQENEAALSGSFRG